MFACSEYVVQSVYNCCCSLHCFTALYVSRVYSEQILSWTCTFQLPFGVHQKNPFFAYQSRPMKSERMTGLCINLLNTLTQPYEVYRTVFTNFYVLIVPSQSQPILIRFYIKKLIEVAHKKHNVLNFRLESQFQELWSTSQFLVIYKRIVNPVFSVKLQW